VNFIKLFGITDVGLKRKLNEDNFVILERGGNFIAAVSDGMGGHNAGDVASREICGAISGFANDGEFFKNIKVNAKKLVALSNSRVYERSRREKSLSGMGATLVGGLCDSK
jgi:protein phosphatase